MAAPYNNGMELMCQKRHALCKEGQRQSYPSPNRPKPVTTLRTQQNQQHTPKTTPETLTTRATLAAVEGGATLDGAQKPH
jgi:hypothetical protein